MNELKIIIWGGIVFFFKDLFGKMIWSFVIYLCRGELNHDNDESTFDKYLHFNKETAAFYIKYVTKYTLLGVHVGFFTDIEGQRMWVQKFYFWLDWADDRTNRFPWPIEMDENQTDEQILNLLKRRKV